MTSELQIQKIIEEVAMAVEKNDKKALTLLAFGLVIDLVKGISRIADNLEYPKAGLGNPDFVAVRKPPKPPHGT